MGHTKEMIGRLDRHLSNHSGFTSRAKDWELVYQEVYKNKSEAYQRELQVKKWKSRKMIERLIEENR